jgi:hypothetical protein
MYRTVDKAILLGSQEIHQKIERLTIFCGKELAAKSIMCHKLTKSEWHKIRIKDFAPLFSDCLYAARNDLEIFPKLYNLDEMDLISKTIEELEEELSKGTIRPEEAKQHLHDIKIKLKKIKRN